MIAATAGLSPAAVYVHFRTKEEILFRISEDGHRDALALVLQAIGAHDNPPSQLRAASHDLAEWHARCNSLARVVQYELGALTPAHADQIAAVRRLTHDAVRAVLIEGADDGRFVVSDADVVTIGILSLGIDVARWFRTDGRWSPSYVGARYAELALRLAGYDPARLP